MSSKNQIMRIIYSLFLMACPSFADDFDKGYQASMELLKSGADDKAEIKLKELKAEFPLRPEAPNALGHLYAVRNDFQNAEKMYKEALALDGEKSANIQGLAVSYLGQKKFEKLSEIKKDLMAIKNDNGTVVAILLGVAQNENDREMFFAILEGLDSKMFENPNLQKALVKSAYLISNPNPK